MLKRCQILLDGWQVDYLKDLAGKIDFSFSELVRMFVSEAVLCQLCLMSPEKATGLNLNDLMEMKKKILSETVKEEEKHKIISKLYFEARKAAELQMGDNPPGKGRKKTG